MKQWTIDQSRTLYNIEHWGTPYFDINADGNVSVSPDGSKKTQLIYFSLPKKLKEQD